VLDSAHFGGRSVTKDSSLFIGRMTTRRETCTVSKHVLFYSILTKLQAPVFMR